MQPTKYHSAQESPTGGVSVGLVGISCDVTGAIAPRAVARSAARASKAARSAPDLIEEHLTYEVLFSQYRQGSHGGVLKLDVP